MATQDLRRLEYLVLGFVLLGAAFILIEYDRPGLALAVLLILGVMVYIEYFRGYAGKHRPHERE